MPATAQEQLLLELVNRARLDPNAEAARLGMSSLNEGLAAGTISSASKAVLAGNEDLLEAALGHSNHMLNVDLFAHSGIGDGDPFSRITGAGYSFTGSWAYGENIAWTGSTGAIDPTATAEQLYSNLFTDYNVADRGHRLNILSDNFREMGNGYLTGLFTKNGITYNAGMLTQNFAKSGDNVFITGVAITDADADNFYDVGEGRGGISVAVQKAGVGVGSDVTEGAGGWRVGIAPGGDATVTFSGGGLPTSVSATVTGVTSNVKVDLLGNNKILSSASTILGDGALTLDLLGTNNLDGTGNSLNNNIFGNSGVNTLDGQGGNDMLFGGLGADRHLGGAGVDYARYDDTYYGNLVVSLANPVQNTGVAAGDTYVDIEGIISGAGNDILYGNALDNYLIGQGGTDMLFGGAGRDYLHGGAGFDYARYDDAAYGNLVVSLSAPSRNTGAALGDTFIDIEGIISGSGSDYLYGNALANTLIGQGGNDNLFGGLGGDTLNGGVGFDYARYDEGGYAGLTVSLASPAVNTGAAAGDSFVDIEGLILTNNGDNASGNSLGNYIYGLGGSDTLNGREGRDFLFGGADVGVSDTFVFNVAATAANADVIGDFQRGTDQLALATAIYGNNEADIYFNAASNNVMWRGTNAGSAADDVVIATLTGVNQFTTADYFFI